VAASTKIKPANELRIRALARWEKTVASSAFDAGDLKPFLQK
jgi:hypothetical protein